MRPFSPPFVGDIAGRSINGRTVARGAHDFTVEGAA